MSGFRVVFAEPNAQIHLVLALIAIALGFYCQISNMEWLAVVFAIASVIGAEAMNTAVEKTVDLASPDWHETAGQAKDGRNVHNVWQWILDTRRVCNFVSVMVVGAVMVRGSQK